MSRLPHKEQEFDVRILELDETHNLDFKEKISGKIGKIIAGMANSEGGKIFVGISDKKPRKIFAVNYTEIEQIVNNCLNNMKPRPIPKLIKIITEIDNEKKNIVCIEVPKMSELVQEKGIFPYRDTGSSHTRYLNYQEITEYHKKSDYLNDHISSWVSKKFLEKPKHEYLIFYLIPPTLNYKQINFLYNRDIENIMLTNETNNKDVHGIRSKVYVSWENPKFKHPITDFFKENPIFHNQQQFTTCDFHKIFDERTGSEVMIMRNGVIQGKMLFQYNSSKIKEETIDFDLIFINHELYSIPSENDIFPLIPLGSFKRACALMSYLFNQASIYPWITNSFNSFDGAVFFFIEKGKKSRSEIIYEKREYLGENNYFNINFLLQIDYLGLSLESKNNEEIYRKILPNYIENSLNDLENTLKPQILSYFGKKYTTSFANRRKVIDKPLIDISKLPERFYSLFLNKIKTHPLLEMIFPKYTSKIEKEHLQFVEHQNMNLNVVNLYELNSKKIPKNLQNWYNEIQLSNKRAIFIGLQFNFICNDGWYYDEYIGGISNLAEYTYTHLLDGVISLILTRILEKDQYNFSKELLNHIENFEKTAIENKLPNFIKFNSEGKAEIIIDRIHSFQKKTYESKLDNIEDIGIIFEEDIKFEEENINHIWSLKGLQAGKNYLFSCGSLGDKIHLIYSMEKPRFIDYRNFIFEFIFYLDIPKNSLYQFDLSKK